MVKIRLMRTGKKKRASYRVVVADSASPRDGRIIESIGHYLPRSDPSEIVIDDEPIGGGGHGLGKPLAQPRRSRHVELASDAGDHHGPAPIHIELDQVLHSGGSVHAEPAA